MVNITNKIMTLLMDVIDKYQTLIGAFVGSFLAILSSILLWFLKDFYENRRLIKNARKEIDSIFWMAGRDSEEAMRDMKHVIPSIKEGVVKMVEENDLLFFTPPKLNRVFIDEARLITLKQPLDFITQQQIDIAISSVKKFNGYLDHFESLPDYIFDSNIKLINLYSTSREDGVKMYKENIDEYLAHFESIIPTHLETAQRNILRPIVAQISKANLKEYNVMKNPEVDVELNDLAAVILESIQRDLK